MVKITKVRAQDIAKGIADEKFGDKIKEKYGKLVDLVRAHIETHCVPYSTVPKELKPYVMVRNLLAVYTPPSIKHLNMAEREYFLESVYGSSALVSDKDFIGVEASHHFIVTPLTNEHDQAYIKSKAMCKVADKIRSLVGEYWDFLDAKVVEIIGLKTYDKLLEKYPEIENLIMK